MKLLTILHILIKIIVKDRYSNSVFHEQSKLLNFSIPPFKFIFDWHLHRSNYLLI